MSFKITKPVALIETFAGVGSQAMAFRDLGVDFEYWKTSDWDVQATLSYKAIHHPNDNTDYSEGMTKEEVVDALFALSISIDGKSPLPKEKIAKKNDKWVRDVYNSFKASHNLGSITNIHAKDLEIDEKKYTTVLTYSYPCQSISVAGKNAGMKKGSGTRSSLLWEIERILNECEELECLPTVLQMENVDAVHNKKNKPDFDEWISFLESKGYKNYWQDCNSKDYGVAQSRKRCFMISLLSDEPYIFPEPIPLTSRLKDYLEEKVDEKFYINNDKAKKLINDLIERGELPSEKVSTALLINKGEKLYKYTDVSETLMARQWKGFPTQAMSGVIEKDE